MSASLSDREVAFVSRATELDQLGRHLFSAITLRKPVFALVQGDYGVGKTALVERFMENALVQQPSLLVGRGKCTLESETSGLVPFSQVFVSLFEEAVRRKLIEGNGWQFVEQVAPAWWNILSYTAYDESLLHHAQDGDSAADSRMPDETAQFLGHKPLIELYRTLSVRFNVDELRTLCFSLGVDYEDLPGESKSGRATALIEHLLHRNRVADLAQVGMELRPDIAWQVLVEHATCAQEASARQTPALSVDPTKFSQDQVFAQFTNFIGRIGAKCPTVVFIDDLQWAGESSLLLFSYLANRLSEGQVLVIGTYRPVEAMETGAHAEVFRRVRASLVESLGAVEISLREGIDVQEYISQRYPIHNFPPHFAERIQERTDGHALFVNQLFSWWEQTRTLAYACSHEGPPMWTIAAETDLLKAMPPTVGAILDERIRLLDKRLRDILVRAAVQGEDFTAQTIINLLALDELQAFEDIDTLERSYQLVQERGSEEVGAAILDLYRFSHRFFREHIYSQLSGGQRRLLHRQVGETLERLCDDLRPVAGQLARHFGEARIPVKAAEYALVAAEFEQSQYTWTEGEQWCEYGLGLAERLPSSDEVKRLRLKLLERSGAGRYYSGEYGKAAERYRIAIELAEELGADAEHIADLCERMADICDELEDQEEGMKFVERGQAALNQHAMEPGEPHLKLAAIESILLSGLNRYEPAIELAQQVLLDAEQLPQTHVLNEIRASAHIALSLAFCLQDRYPEAVAADLEAVKIAEQLGDRHRLATYLAGLADDYSWMGDWDEAEALASRALQIAHQIGDRACEAYTLAVRGYVCVLHSKYEQAKTDLVQAIAVAEEIGYAWVARTARADLALAHLGLSDAESAYQLAKQSLALATKRDQTAYPLDALGQAEIALGCLEEAVEHFDQSIAIRMEEGQDRHFIARTQRQCAIALDRKGEQEQAVELLKASLATFEELELPHEIAETRRILQTIGG